MVRFYYYVGYYFILVLILHLYQDQVCHGQKIGNKLRHRRGHSKRSAFTMLGKDWEKKERFCLNRLRDALHTVCSGGTGSAPLYFSPDFKINQFAPLKNNISDTDTLLLFDASNNLRSESDQRKKTKKFLNEIPAIPQPARPILRRRSRRNIVRECCEKPCSYSYLGKYCSVSTSFLPRKPESANDLNLIRKGAKIVNINHYTGSAGAAASKKCHGNPKCNLGQPDYDGQGDEDVILSASMQCIPIADLKLYFRKLYLQTQWRKDTEQVDKINGGGLILKSLNDTNNTTTMESNERTTLTTNFIPDSTTPKTIEYESPSKYNGKKSFQSKSSSEVEPDTGKDPPKSDGNEERRPASSEEHQSEKAKSRQPYISPYVVTIKPIKTFISLPLGSIDYL